MRDRDSCGSVLESLLAWDPCSPSNGNMTLPVSSYEELLVRVRNLTHETIQLQRELATPLANSPATLASLQLDQNLNERVVPSLDEATYDNTKHVANGGTWPTSTAATAAAAAHLTSTTPPPHGEPRRPNSFQRPLSSHADDRRSWSMNRKSSSSSSSGSGHRERPRTAEARPYANDESGEARAMLSLLGKLPPKQKENGMEPKEEDEKRPEFQCKQEALSPQDVTDCSLSPSFVGDRSTQAAEERQNVSALYHGTWPVEKSLWHSCGPSSVGGSKSLNQDASSVMSFSSSVGSSGGPAAMPGAARRTYSQQQLTSKVDMVYSLLSMLGTQETRDDMTKTLLAMSSSPDSCQTMRQSGCLPLLVQFIHVTDQNSATRQRASQTLHNLVHSQADDKRGRREARVLRLLELVREYCDSLRDTMQEVAAEEERGNHVQRPAILDDMERHPGPTIAALMKLSFDEEHRHAMCQLGGLHAIAELIQLDHAAHGSTASDQHCVTLRRYAGMALTNLTFGDGTNKALLCSFRDFMRALVAQLHSPSEDLRQVTASVLRNLSWRADGASKQTLREVGAVTGLMCAAIDGKKESTLKSILSALWNLSAHCSLNKVDICAVDGALGFLIGMLDYKAPSKTLAIIENAGGILRNISSHVAIREDYRTILREHKCLQVLLQQLKSPSLTIVSNACGTLWNLSARCPEDQKALWEMGAVNMLRSLVHSKHKMISMGSSAALKNLLSAKPNNNYPLDATAKQFGLPVLPSLLVRKQKALEQELDQNLSETCDNIEPSTSPSGLVEDKFVFAATEHMTAEERHRHLRSQYQSLGVRYSKSHVSRSDSRDSVTSTMSDTVYERVSRTNDVLGHTSPSGSGPSRHCEKASSVHGALTDNEHGSFSMSASADKKFIRRYTTTMKDRNERRKVLSLEISNEDNVLEKDSVQGSEELGSPYSRLGHSDDIYLEKNRDSRRVRERVQESLTASSSSEAKTERDAKGSAVYDATGKEFLSAARPVPSNGKGQYVSRPNANAYPRNKFSDLELDAGVKEEPVDYSLKYVEPSQSGVAKNFEPVEKVKAEKKTQNDLGRGYAPRNPEAAGATKNMKMNVVYGDYAETDLDQPTDYSLKYAEEDDDLEFEKNVEAESGTDPQFYEGSSPVHEDTLKTYYTEGTPYETPYNFSTATSMSDLRSDLAAQEEKKADISKDCAPQTPKTEALAPNFHASSVEKELQVKVLPPSTTPPLKQSQSGLSSGLMSPDKPVNYCEEGTPGSFSRVSSLSSLNSIPVNIDTAPLFVAPSSPVKDSKPVETSAVSVVVQDEVVETSFEKEEPREGKMVTFNSTDHYAEETPLMFSRCSSLGSLSSFEQHSIHDDRSSVISDFSRRTSGMVSPSELPDSPTQTVPPSPRRTKAPLEFTAQLPEHSAAVRALPPRQTAKPSVFEDDVAAFKEEDTPVDFSRATSLSSLTIDDEPKITNDIALKDVPKPCRSVGVVVPSGIHHARRAEREKEDGMEKQDVEKEKRDLSDCCELAPVSEGEEDDEDMLAACINIGMQNTRHKYKTTTPPRFVAARARSSGIPVKAAAPRSSHDSSSSSVDTGTKSTAVDLPGACEDALLTYCTEGTPANISHAGSHSDLSILSFACDTDEHESRGDRPKTVETQKPHDVERPELSDDSSNFSGDNDNILAECIQSGMPTARPPRPQAAGSATSESNLSTAASGVTVRVHLNRQPHLGVGPKHPVRRPLHYPLRDERPLRLPKDDCDKVGHNLAARDEFETYATEGSPNTYSTRSSLSDLTVSTEGGAGIASCLRRPVRSRPVSEGGASCDASLRFATDDSPLRFATEDTPLEISHAASLSSLSCGEEEHFEPSSDPSFQHPDSWEDGSQQTASASKQPFNKANSVSEDVVTVLSRHGSLSSLSVDSFGSTEPTPSEQALLEQCINSGMPKSKAVKRVTSRHQSGNGFSTATGFSLEDRMESLRLTDRECDSSKNGVTSSVVISSLEHTATDIEGQRSPNVEEETNERREERTKEVEPSAECEEKTIVIVTEDPATPAKVDGENAMKQSVERNTWDDDFSPNDVSFPSMSSAPLLPSSLESAVEPPAAAMTESRMIQFEAEKLTTAFRIEGQNTYDMEQSMTSLNSMDLEAMKPPSMIDSLISLTASVSEMGDCDERQKCSSTSLMNPRGRPSKKKAIPAGVMVRRALGTTHNSMDSMLDNVSMTSTTSQIDNVMPPSAMDDLFDIADMENSMISVASITSEVADIAKESHSDSLGHNDAVFEFVRPSANAVVAALNSAAGDMSDIDNAIPPSILNDVTEMTMEPGSETMCSDTEIGDDPAYTHTLDDVDAPELPSDGSLRTTPLASELSSAESTPKKRQKHRLLTPKQKRQMGKERYKTYTISAEEERQLEEIRKLNEEKAKSAGGTLEASEGQTAVKLTPKQRRLENRSRFETRVLDRTYTIEPETKTSGIPKLGIRKNIKTLKEKRAAARDRYRTRTLSENVDPSPEQIDALIQRDANLVISSLNETRHHSESDDMMLECETLSLISIDSESEHHSKKRIASRENSVEETQEVDEKTYRADSLTPMEDTATLCEMLEDTGDSTSEEEKEIEAVGPRITKPSNHSVKPVASDETSTNPEAEVAKGIRGRRKNLYASSVSRRGHTVSVVAAKSRSTVPVGSVPSGPVRSTRASAMRQVKGPTGPSSRPVVSLPGTSGPRSTFNKVAPSARSVPVVAKPSVSVQEKSRFRPPERQGTFTKDDASVQLCSAPPSPSKTRIPVPASTPSDGAAKLKLLTDSKKRDTFKTPLAIPSKVKLRRESSQPIPNKSSANRLAKTLSLDGKSTKTASLSLQPNKPLHKSYQFALPHSGVRMQNRKGVVGLRNSVSNQSLQSQLSASNSSLNSVSSSGKAKIKPPKKEVTSKIASLWKRVEEIQVQQRFPKKDTRVWITAEGKEEHKKQATSLQQKLVRSSTFDGITPKSQEGVAPSVNAIVPIPKRKAGNKVSTVTVSKSAKSKQASDSGSGNGDQRVGGVTAAEVVLRRKNATKTEDCDADEAAQRLSRLGSFFRLDPSEIQDGKPIPKGPASAIVPPFNYNPPTRPVVSTNIPGPVKPLRVVNADTEPINDQVNTASKKVTTV